MNTDRMEYYHRRNRRRKCRGPCSVPTCVQTPQSSSHGFCSYLVMSSLFAIIYLLLEYNCSTCGAKGDLNNITKHVEDIAKNLQGIKESYRDLERRIEIFSMEIPRFEGQLGILEALTAFEPRDLEWDPQKHRPLPNVDVTLCRRRGNTTKNVTTTFKEDDLVKEI